MKKKVSSAQSPSIPVETEPWHTLSPQEVLEHLRVRDNGLTSAQVAERLAQYGPNQLTESPRPGFLAMLWDQFNNFIVMLLIVASVISALLGEWIDASAIMSIVLLNAILGIVQERRAEEALAALKKLAAPEAHIMRDGHRTSVPARELVPGDIVYLEAGNHIPADVRLLEAVNLQVEEASLTGESLPVQKNAAMKLEKNIPLGDRRNTAFMGTTVTYGRGRGVVVGTGMRTQLGMIARMLQQVDQEETPLQKRLDQLGKTLGWGALAICGIVFIVAVFRGTDLDILTAPGGGFLAYLDHAKKEIVQMFMLAVGLAIAAVPEGLPAVVTITLALGMHEMIRHHALIRRLSSVETLGSATVICSDKTGTLTQNEMTVTRLWADEQFVTVTGSGYSRRGEFTVDGKPNDLKKYPAILTTLWVGALNNDSQLEPMEGDDQSYRIVGDPTEGALLVAAAKSGAYRVDLGEAYPRQDEVPFDSERKRMITIHDVAEPRAEDISPFHDDKLRGWDVIAVKGAPDVVLDMCTHYQSIDDKTMPLDDAARQRILAANDAMTQDALRVLCMAYRVVPEASGEAPLENLERELTFAGLMGMIDPARPEVRPALEKAARAGIRTVMITGDYPNTARAIAQAIGLLRPSHKVLTGADVDRMSDDVLKSEIEQVDVFARVSPEHKMRIVNALQANDEVVAMTGDGVNDAPALKTADIGIAMGQAGTDVAREAADLILLDDNFASLVAGIEEGRAVFDNIRKFLTYILTSNIPEIVPYLAFVLFRIPLPLTVIQILAVDLGTDMLPALALGAERSDPAVMRRPPRARSERLLTWGLVARAYLFLGVLEAAAAMAAFFLVLDAAGWHYGQMLAKTDPLYLQATTACLVAIVAAQVANVFLCRHPTRSIVDSGVRGNLLLAPALAVELAVTLAIVYTPPGHWLFGTASVGFGVWLAAGLFTLAMLGLEEARKAWLRRRLSL